MDVDKSDQRSTTLLSRREFAGFAVGMVAASTGVANAAHASAYTAFGPPKEVTILGYTGDAMEPFLTRDGSLLLFNNRNQAPVNTNLFWAERKNDLTFEFRGEIAGVNTDALEAVASVDSSGMLYFVSTRSYAQTYSTLYRAPFKNGIASAPALVPGVSKATPGWVNFDAEISADGTSLYFVDSYFGSAGSPQNASIVLAQRSGTGFVRSSLTSLAAVNMAGLNYAPCTTASELELFFTNVGGIGTGAEPSIYRSARVNTSEAFSAPQRISAIEGFTEAPTVTPDDSGLYYHALVNGRYVLRFVQR
jgi:hypothetical protein